VEGVKQGLILLPLLAEASPVHLGEGLAAPLTEVSLIGLSAQRYLVRMPSQGTGLKRAG
jgi:hypothetical protein